MRLTHIASNQTELDFGNGLRVLFSYSTPVAAFIPGGRGFVKAPRYSVTTTRHVNKWLRDQIAEEVPQKELEDLIAVGGRA